MSGCPHIHAYLCALVLFASPLAAGASPPVESLAVVDGIVILQPRASTLDTPGTLSVLNPAPAEIDPLFADDDDFDFDLEEDVPAVADPLEGFNRGVFAFNETVDTFAWDPITRTYIFVMPDLGRRGVRRFFLNLESPAVFANQLLQLRFGDAGKTFGRFLLNSTAGGLGFFDPAGRGAGWEREEGDFGQTLARYGVPSGPYLMMPVFGPSNVRDVFGGVVDRMMDPLTYVIGPVSWWIALGASEGIAVREANFENLEALESSSVDFYSALRSAYSQSREASIRDAREDALDPISVSLSLAD